MGKPCLCTDDEDMELMTDNDLCNIHNKNYTKICDDHVYCNECEIPNGLYMDIDDWKKRTLIEMQKFEDKLNNKIKGLNCIIEIVNNHREITKQIEDIMDTVFVDISHIYNFNKFIDDIPISNLIKRKNQILNNKPIKPLDIIDNIPRHLTEFINMIINNDGDIHATINAEMSVGHKNDVLGWASVNGHLAIVECLIKYGADIHANDDKALKIASYNGKLAIVECLISHGANIHSNDDYALTVSCRNHHLDVIECLIKHGADIHVDNDWVFRYAAGSGHLAVVKILIKNGADIHACNYYALQKASVYGFLDVVECIISHGADKVGDNNITRLDCTYKHLTIICNLIKCFIYYILYTIT
jgi:ankyrin repeat protein